jgi:hypothetical protein
VKDVEPDPEIEIRTRSQKAFKEFTRRVFTKAIESELTSNSRRVEDPNISLARKIGLLRVARPQKLLVDAVAER